MTDTPARLVFDALNFAALRHRSQRRKGREGAPYVNHLIEVAHVLTRHGVEDPVTLCAAILHDAVEDAEVTAEELVQRFGGVVTSIVLELTDDPDVPRWTTKLAQIEGAPSLSDRAQDIRVADKISNLRGVLTSPPSGWSIERKLAYYAWAEQVVVGCTRARAGLRRTFEDVHASGRAALELQAAHQARRRAVNPEATAPAIPADGPARRSD